MKKILNLAALIALALALTLTVGCGDKAEESTDETVMHKCSACDMEMAATEMVDKDGVWYCSHCAPAEEPAEGEAEEPEHDHDDHEGHDHG